MNHEPPITLRFVPPVAGVDLEHALHYVAAGAIPRCWFYQSFTWPRTFYRRGSRPALEALLEAERCTGGGVAELQKIIDLVYARVRHFSLLGIHGDPARGLSEEGLLLLGQGWCNEQARVFSALCQVADFPTRLVFAAMATGKGHVLTEVYCEGKWTLVDQTAAYRFADAEGRGINLADLEAAAPSLRGYVSQAYGAALRAERPKAVDPAFWDEFVSYGVVNDPLELFHSVGYCNYFIH